MMGYTHATSAAVLSLAVLPVVAASSALGHASVSGAAVAVSVGVVEYVVCGAGSGVLNDLDHHSATPAREWGPVTKVLARGIGTVFGGHRNGTHSIFGIACFTGFALLLNHLGVLLTRYNTMSPASWVKVPDPYLVARIAVAIEVAFLLDLALTALDLRPFRSDTTLMVVTLAVALAMVFTNTFFVVPIEPIPYAVATGMTAHIMGDMLTKEGCPLLWNPLMLLPKNKRPAWLSKVCGYRFKVLNLTTDTGPEKLIAFVLSLVLVWLLLLRAGWMGPITEFIKSVSDQPN